MSRPEEHHLKRLERVFKLYNPDQKWSRRDLDKVEEAKVLYKKAYGVPYNHDGTITSKPQLPPSPSRNNDSNTVRKKLQRAYNKKHPDVKFSMKNTSQVEEAKKLVEPSPSPPTPPPSPPPSPSRSQAEPYSVNHLLSNIKDSSGNHSKTKIINYRSKMKQIYNCLNNTKSEKIPDSFSINDLFDYDKVIDCVLNLKTLKNTDVKNKVIYFAVLNSLFQIYSGPKNKDFVLAWRKYSYILNYLKIENELINENLIGQDGLSKTIREEPLKSRISTPQANRYNEKKLWVNLDQLIKLYKNMNLKRLPKERRELYQLIIALNIFLPVVRRDMRTLKIVDEKDVGDNINENLLVLRHKKPIKIILNKITKTGNAFKSVEYNLAEDYENVIKPIESFITKTNKQVNEFLFSNSVRTDSERYNKLVKDAFQYLTGKPINIEVLRHIYITDNWLFKRDIDEVVNDVIAQGHGLKAELNYIRKI